MEKRALKKRQPNHAQKSASASKKISKANFLIDPLEPLVAFHKYSAKNGEIIELRCYRVEKLSLEMKKWIFDLMERNMKAMYEKSNWGWNEAVKQAELTGDTARYLIATCEEKMIGFSHFRFDMDQGIEVLYCYELQLELFGRGKGLGRFMMQSLEAMAANSQLQKVVLTVLKQNFQALTFFQKVGYKLDVSNPPPTEKVDYVILSKPINKSIK